MSTSDLQIPELGEMGLPGLFRVKRFKLKVGGDSDQPNTFNLPASGSAVLPLFRIGADTDNPVLVENISFHKITGFADSTSTALTLTVGTSSDSANEWITDTTLKPDTTGTVVAEIRTVYTSDQQLYVKPGAVPEVGEMDMFVSYSRGGL